MKKATYTIGSDNKTGELRRDAIEAKFSEHFLGFTSWETNGNWEGVGERSLRIEVHTNEPILVIEGVARIVCKQFGQQAVMLEITASDVQFISAL